MNNKVKRLIELLENNMQDMWQSNLFESTECIVLEDIELKDMLTDDEIDEDDFVNKKFNGGEIVKLIEELKKDLNNTQ